MNTSDSGSSGVAEAYVESALAWVCDYNTGVALDDDNEFDVDCKCELLYGNFEKIYPFSRYTYVPFSKEWYARDLKYNFTIVYPEDYKGLCIGASGNGSYKEDVFAGKYLWWDYIKILRRKK